MYPEWEVPYPNVSKTLNHLKLSIGLVLFQFIQYNFPIHSIQQNRRILPYLQLVIVRFTILWKFRPMSVPSREISGRRSFLNKDGFPFRVQTCQKSLWSLVLWSP